MAEDAMREFTRALLGAPRTEPEMPETDPDEMRRFVRDLFADTDD